MPKTKNVPGHKAWWLLEENEGEAENKQNNEKKRMRWTGTQNHCEPIC